jgi:lysophospholipase L1-like esterase
MKNLLLVFVCGFLMCTTSSNTTSPDTNTASTNQKPKIWVLGNSTVCNYVNHPAHRVGWAQVLPNYLNTNNVEVHNKAISGRSSKDFVSYANGWNSFKDSISANDYVIIEFGHNDEVRNDPALGTLPGSTFERYLSIYVDYSKSVGAIPILATPIERNEWANNAIEPSHVKSYGDYPQAIRNLAKSKNIDLVDMTALTTELYERIGQESTTKLFVTDDRTHINEAGANQIAKLFVNDITSQGIKPFSNWVKRSVSIKQVSLHLISVAMSFSKRR